MSPLRAAWSLRAAITAGGVQQLVMLGGNPAYTAPGSLSMAAAIRSVPLSVHLGDLRDETSSNVDWHIPQSHGLESWGDLRSADGTISIQQPLIAPLHASASALTVLARLVGDERSDHALVQAHWGDTASFDDFWRLLLTSGVSAGSEHGWSAPDLSQASAAWPAASDAPGATPEGAYAIELNITLDSRILDGRYAHNPWLQELPDTATKLTWDNALLVGVQTATEAGIATGDMVRLTTSTGSVTLPVLITPGLADQTASVAMGNGRTHAGKYGDGTGFDVAAVNDGSWIVSDATLQKVDGHHLLACTQQQGGMDDTESERTEAYRRVPTFVRSTTFDDYLADAAVKSDDPGAIAAFVQEKEVMAADKLKSLWEPPNRTDGQQWGMTVDLSACHGCGACVVACQAENNVPIVGKEDVLKGREMHWIRIDHYQTGPGDDIEHAIQPVACTHCETAPCENVCPVAATAHSPEGLNDIAYNRCIGTRYCANNCPFKVRRFNYFNYTKRMDEDHGEFLAMRRNPDVTVRFRGVIEKCSYCVQRITEAKIEAKRDGNGVVPDGRIVPACQQSCPTSAIVFGDINDKTSRVAALKASPRNYGLLSELNLHSRTTYLAAVRNPNPELVKS
jgi:molybdopterin-containing oxidoreductase family iron-sulfur binding subunit